MHYLLRLHNLQNEGDFSVNVKRLKLCPKCGGTPVIVHSDDDWWRVHCWWDSSCRCSTNWCITEEQAIEEWNEDNPMPEFEYLDEETFHMNFYDFTLDEDQKKFVKAVMSPNNISVFCSAVFLFLYLDNMC